MPSTVRSMAEILNTPLGVGWDRTRGWRDQYERMLRWRSRLLREIETEALNGSWETWPDDLWDTAMAFFQSAFHLKDWILHDHADLRAELEFAISSSPRLAICADISNGTKHRRVTRNHRVPAHVVGMREFAPDVPSRARWLVFGPDGPINLDVLATDVVRAWDAVLHQVAVLGHVEPT